MLSVYICEDQEEVRRIQRECLEKQIMIQGYDMEIALSSGCPGEILEAVEKNPGRGIYFLDVELKGEEMDGFALGREIRRLDPRGFIVYVTAYGNLAFETFRYHLEALDYIVKESMEKMGSRKQPDWPKNLLISCRSQTSGPVTAVCTRQHRIMCDLSRMPIPQNTMRS